jgi:predicted acetyltransferase
MKIYLDCAYNIDKLKNELSDKNSKFYFLYANDALAGYIKINENEAQTDINDEQSLQVERLYIIKEYQGSGLGKVINGQGN